MAYQAVFRRYEIKYLLTEAQKERILAAMAPYMEPDVYGHTSIRNIYFDTDDYRMIRRSLEKPIYKEKLRIRGYRQAEDEDRVFVELKKKFDGVVYKRRLDLPAREAMAWVCGEAPCPEDSQIAREIDYVLSYYGTLRPRVFLSYERDAFRGKEDPQLRITFDRQILCRQDRLALSQPVDGNALLPPDRVLMEVKTTGGMPLWLAQVLTEEKIFKTAFSKYGKAYEEWIFNGGKNDAG